MEAAGTSASLLHVKFHITMNWEAAVQERSSCCKINSFKLQWSLQHQIYLNCRNCGNKCAQTSNQDSIRSLLILFWEEIQNISHTVCCFYTFNPIWVFTDHTNSKRPIQGHISKQQVSIRIQYIRAPTQSARITKRWAENPLKCCTRPISPSALY